VISGGDNLRVRSTLVLTLGLVAAVPQGRCPEGRAPVQALQADLAKSDAARRRNGTRSRLPSGCCSSISHPAGVSRPDARRPPHGVAVRAAAAHEPPGARRVSQQRITELRSRIESRAQQADPNAPTGTPVGPSGNPPAPVPIRCTMSRCNSTAAAVSRPPGWASGSSCASFPRMNARRCPLLHRRKLRTDRTRFRGGGVRSTRAYLSQFAARSVGALQARSARRTAGDKTTARTFTRG